ncbi:MAG: diacylglycerol kinase family protein [Pirellulaceae bacterium]
MSIVAPRHVLIAANPKSGSGVSRGLVAQLNDSFSNHGLNSRIVTSLDELQASALQLHDARQLRAVVSAGGDGTVAALANLLPADIPILIFPLGTENLLAKHLGLSTDIGPATELALHGRVQSLDVGSANGKLFLVMLSCGFDAEVVRRMHAVRRGHINRWSYARPILSSLRSYGFPQLSPVLETTTGATSDSAAWLFVFNVPRYAAGLNFCPQADPLDGELDACTFRKSGIMHGIGYLGRLWFGTHQSLRGFAHRRCTGLHVPVPLDRRGNPLEIPYQIDGDPGGLLPLNVRVLPKRLSLLCNAPP